MASPLTLPSLPLPIAVKSHVEASTGGERLTLLKSGVGQRNTCQTCRVLLCRAFELSQPECQPQAAGSEGGQPLITAWAMLNPTRYAIS